MIIIILIKRRKNNGCNGALLNWKFTPSCLAGETGRDNLISLLDEIKTQKIMHSQFNVISRETLEDTLKHQEEYKNLLVRVAGHSDCFVDLRQPLQQDIMVRTELSLE